MSAYRMQGREPRRSDIKSESDHIRTLSLAECDQVGGAGPIANAIIRRWFSRIAAEAPKLDIAPSPEEVGTKVQGTSQETRPA